MNKSSQMSSPNSLRRQPKQQRGQQRVAKILTAAAEVFAQVGYSAATIQQIADRASTAVGSIYQFFPDKLAIFNAIFTEHMRLTECIEADFFAQKLDRPLDRGISEYIDAYAIYFEEPIPRCIVVQYYLQPIGGMESMMADIPTLQSISIERHANFYRQRNPNLSIAKSELLSEVAHNIVQGLVPNALKNDEKYRQEIYADDGTPEAMHPYTVSERDYEVRRLQHAEDQDHAVFFVHPRHTITLHYERRPNRSADGARDRARGRRLRPCHAICRGGVSATGPGRARANTALGHRHRAHVRPSTRGG
ncbi:MAG: TetR family transcriptional regulator [Chamaesiphon sp. CSU_1_12]|nr:TetR family transcriptional regulator [Chamaesiphon sp. CSU_1_12]